MENVKYREVARKAAVGERIKIVEAYVLSGAYKNGDVMTVWKRQESEPVGVWANESSVFVYDREYVVLEPVGTAAATPDPAEALAESFRQFVLANADAIRAILPALETQLSVQPPVKVALPKTLSRAEVIAKATADVAKITTDLYGDVDPGAHSNYGMSGHMSVVFNVNREKRTVVALVGWRYVPGVRNRGIAKAAPDDVFHAEIGKAIALRRALGLAVPDEYVNAPKPDEPRIGAVVQRINGVPDSGRVGKVTAMRPDGFSAHDRGLVAEGFPGTGWSYIDRVSVIDDTDVDYGAEVIASGGAGNPLFPLRKGAA